MVLISSENKEIMTDNYFLLRSSYIVSYKLKAFLHLTVKMKYFSIWKYVKLHLVIWKKYNKQVNDKWRYISNICTMVHSLNVFLHILILLAIQEETSPIKRWG